jgi:hypothetical protein
LRPHLTGSGIDPHPSHRGEIDHHAIVGHGVAGHVVAAPSDGDLALLIAGELECVSNVSRRVAAGDECRTLVDGSVVDATSRLVPRILLAEQ